MAEDCVQFSKQWVSMTTAAVAIGSICPELVITECVKVNKAALM